MLELSLSPSLSLSKMENNGRPISTRFVALFVFILVHETVNARNNHSCSPSSCGQIHNITHPFRLKDHPNKCGDKRYTLSCENNVTVLYLYSGKYYVQAINYQNYTIRLLDSNVEKENYSSIPRNSLSFFNFTHRDPYSTWYHNPNSTWDYNSMQSLIFFNCENPVSSPLYIDTAPCITGNNTVTTSSSSAFSQSKSYYSYIMATKRDFVDVSVLEHSCRIELMVMASWKGENKNITSYMEIHNELADGFELS